MIESLHNLQAPNQGKNNRFLKLLREKRRWLLGGIGFAVLVLAIFLYLIFTPEPNEITPYVYTIF